MARTLERPTVRYNVQRLADDMAERGWSDTELARRADVSIRTVGRFLSEQHQTAKTLKKFAEAFGHSTRRYVIRSSEQAA